MMPVCPYCNCDLAKQPPQGGVCPQCKVELQPPDAAAILEVTDADVPVDGIAAKKDTDTAESEAKKTVVPDQLREIWNKAGLGGISAGATIRLPQTDVFVPSNLHIKTQIIANPEKPAEDNKEEDFDQPADFEIVSKLGEGGMGVIYVARQMAMDRIVAIKMLKEKRDKIDRSRGKFLAEAAVTAKLDHPNIVPVHQLGMNEDGMLFYAMKKVQGVPWDKVIRNKPLTENLKTFLNICDAVAFAHSKGVIHRDIKPENVMLGEYGEVLLMDWGMAVSVMHGSGAELISEKNCFGGTPAYMAPEMAQADMSRIGARSDIYLLGAMLFEIATGRPPHPGKDAVTSLQAAAANIIVPTEKKGELIRIAMKALSTMPQDRYMTVKELQTAIKDCQAHTESLSAMTRAAEALRAALATKSYSLFAKAVFGCEEAVTMWPGNARAKQGISLTKLEYANCALQKGDLDLAASLLDKKDPAHDELRRKIAGAEKERKTKAQVLQSTKRGALAATIGFLIVLTFAFGIVLRAKHNVDDALSKAEREQQHRSEFERKAVPIFIEAARQAVANKKLAQAADVLNIAIELSPNTYEARLLLADIYIVQKDYDQAIMQLEAYLQLNANDSDARTLLKMCRRIKASGESSQTQSEFAVIFASKNELTLAGMAAGASQQLLDIYRARLQTVWPDKKWKIEMNAANEVVLDLTGTDISDLAPLTGMLINEIRMSKVPVADLAPLATMPLKSLDISKTKVLRLNAIKYCPLTNLVIEETQIADLSPLAGMRLERLIAGDTPISDISPLKNSPLTKLAIENTKVTDLAPLSGMKLVELSFSPKLITKNINVIRPGAMPSLLKIGIDSSLGGVPADEFWKRYDQGRPMPPPK